jgi:hypothetical protein
MLFKIKKIMLSRLDWKKLQVKGFVLRPYLRRKAISAILAQYEGLTRGFMNKNSNRGL